MTPIERRSVADTGRSHSNSETPSTKTAKVSAPSSMRLANNSARKLIPSSYLKTNVLISSCNDLEIFGINLGSTVQGLVVPRPEINEFVVQFLLANIIKRRKRS